MEPTLLVSDDELSQHHCLELVDKVQGDPEATAFRRRARLHQSLWREANGLTIGTQPMRCRPGRRCRTLGSRIDLDEARKSERNFLNEAVRRAVHDRLMHRETNQTIDEDRLFCDLLSSMPMCFNLFGTLQGDLDAANLAVHSWWPEAPGKASAVRFEWSPRRSIPGEYLENRSAFDVAFELALGDGGLGVIGVETKYHEHCKREKTPGELRRKRYEEITSKSGIFKPGVQGLVQGTDLQQIWIDHLLALSMIQHPEAKWRWARFVLVFPKQNPSCARAALRYGALLTDTTSFEAITIESLLDAQVLSAETVAAFRERYLW